MTPSSERQDPGARGQTRSISLALPRDWTEVPTEPEAYSRWLEEALSDTTLDPFSRSQLSAALKALLIEARRSGLVLSASYVDQANDAASPSGYQLLVASMFATVLQKSSLAGMTNPYGWQIALKDAERDGDIRLVEEPKVVKVGSLDAAKAVTLDSIPADKAGPAVDLLGSTYYFSLDDGSTVGAIGFRTPCLWLWDEFDTLFDAITESVQIHDS